MFRLCQGCPQVFLPKTQDVIWLLGTGPSSLLYGVIPPVHVCGERLPTNEMGCPTPTPNQLPKPSAPSSPFKIKVLPAHDASKVRASGPGLNASGIPASLPVEFTIDARDAGEGLLTVQILVSPRPAYLPNQALGTGRP